MVLLEAPEVPEAPRTVICLLDPGVDPGPTFAAAPLPPGCRGAYLPIPPSDPHYQTVLGLLATAPQNAFYGFEILDPRTGRVRQGYVAWSRFFAEERVLHVGQFMSTKTRQMA